MDIWIYFNNSVRRQHLLCQVDYIQAAACSAGISWTWRKAQRITFPQLFQSSNIDRTPGWSGFSLVTKCFFPQQDCLQCFFQQDTLTWNNQIYCSFCETKQETAVKANISKAPKIIVFHLKRYGFWHFVRRFFEQLYHDIIHIPCNSPI